MVDLNLKDTYRATDVKRWAIVKTQQPQSVAEHSFQVAMITSRACDHLGLTDSERSEALWLALTHDLPEVLTGDMATPLKQLLGKEFQAKLEAFEESVQVLGKHHNTENARVAQVVKLADLVEAVAFLDRNAVNEHGANVRNAIMDRVLVGPLGWLAAKLLDELCNPAVKEQTLDDVIAHVDV